MVSKVKHTFKNINKKSFYRLLKESDILFALYVSIILIQNYNPFNVLNSHIFVIYFKITANTKLQSFQCFK